MTVVITRTLFALSTSFLGAILCLSLFTTDVFAQVDASAELEAEAKIESETNPQQEARSNTQADRAALREELATSTAQNRIEAQQQVAHRQAALQARTQERVTNLAAKMSNRMEAVIQRLQNITTRLESRIDKLRDSGIDTTSSQAALASAQLSLDAAVLEISDIDTSVYNAVSSADARAGWTNLKAEFTTIGNSIRTAHSELQSSISLLKAASLEARAQQTVEADIE